MDAKDKLLDVAVWWAIIVCIFYFNKGLDTNLKSTFKLRLGLYSIIMPKVCISMTQYYLLILCNIILMYSVPCLTEPSHSFSKFT